MKRLNNYFLVHPSFGGARVMFARTSLFAQTGLGWHGPVVWLGDTCQPMTRGEARRLARAILRLTEKP